MKSTIKTLCIAGMLAIVVSACGGGGGGSPSPAPQAAAQPVIKPVQALWAGDSTSVGYEMINGAYVKTGVVQQDLQTALQAQAGSTVTVSVDGIPNSTLEEFLAGTFGFGQSYSQILSTTPGNLVIENFGLNETVESPAQFEQSLIQFVTSTEQAGKVPILEEPNPSCIAGTPDQELVYGNGLTMGAYAAVVDQVAQTYDLAVVRQYQLIKAMPNFCALMSDGIAHPGDALYAMKAKNQAAVLLPIIQALQKG